MEPHKSVYYYPGYPYFLFSKKSYSSCTFRKLRRSFFLINTYVLLAALAQTVACLPLVQQVRGLIPGGGSKFSFEIFQPQS